MSLIMFALLRPKTNSIQKGGYEDKIKKEMKDIKKFNKSTANELDLLATLVFYGGPRLGPRKEGKKEERKKEWENKID